VNPNGLPAPGTILELEDIAKRFGPTVALDGVDLKLAAGEVHALIGENGAGKSTLMGILAGAVRPDRGRMLLAGEPYAPANPLLARRAGLALIHQELSLFPHLSVTDNILMGVEPARWGWLDREAARRRALEVLESFRHPALRPDSRVGDLPVAARQVVEICRAIAAQVRIVLMDEPTSSLPREDVLRLFSLIRRLSQDGISVIYISHFLEEVREIAQRCTILRDGRSVGSGPLSSFSNDELVARMVGRAVDHLFPERQRPDSGEVLLDVRDLSRPPGLRSASFELRRGEILGIAGLIGSGRSEMVRALVGLDRPAAGSIRFRGRPIPLHDHPSRRLREGFGYLSEDRRGEGLALGLSVADNLTLSALRACATAGFIHLDRQRREAGRFMEEVGVRAHSPAQPVRTLSGGNQQKVALARLLHQGAEVLLLDEPTRGIDVGSRAQIYEVIARCAAEGKAVLMISSYLPELFGVCDRLAVMSRGHLWPARPIEEWTPESVLHAAVGTGAAA
jgi:ribose transport system ATP-binding protein